MDNKRTDLQANLNSNEGVSHVEPARRDYAAPLSTTEQHLYQNDRPELQRSQTDKSHAHLIQAYQENPYTQSEDRREFNQLRSHVELKRTSDEGGQYHVEHHQPATLNYPLPEDAQYSDRKRSRSRSGKPKKHSSRKGKYSHLILEQNSNPPYTSPPTSSENEAMPIGENPFSANRHRGRPNSSQHVHFAEEAEVMNASHQGPSSKAVLPNLRDSHGLQSVSHSNPVPDLLDALSQSGSQIDQAYSQPFTGIQEYELAMLEEKKRKLLQKIERYDVMIHRENDEIVRREIELTEVNMTNVASGFI